MKIPSKLKSVKNWIAFWSIAMITYIVIADKTEFYGIAQLLCAVPLVTTGCNVWQKSIYAKHDISGAGE